VHLVHVDARRLVAEDEPPFLRRLCDFQRVRVLEQRLGRDASPVQARAAQALLPLDDGDLQAELRRADRGRVAAGAGPDDDHVERVRHGWFSW